MTVAAGWALQWGWVFLVVWIVAGLLALAICVSAGRADEETERALHDQEEDTEWLWPNQQ